MNDTKPTREVVEAMLARRGLYICGDTKEPWALVPLWVDRGVAHTMVLDSELSQEGFLPTFVIYSGPHVAPAFADASRADAVPPREPTEAMVDAGASMIPLRYPDKQDVREAWRAMYDAAPAESAIAQPLAEPVPTINLADDEYYGPHEPAEPIATRRVHTYTGDNPVRVVRDRSKMSREVAILTTGDVADDKEQANAAYIAALSPERVLSIVAALRAAIAMRDAWMQPSDVAAFDRALSALAGDAGG